MRKIVTIAFSAGLLAAALPASAANTTANANRNEAQNQANNAASPDDRRICVREASSETRVRRQICHTAREWRDLHGDDEDSHD